MGPADSRALWDLSIFSASDVGPCLAGKWQHWPDKPELWTAGAVARAGLEHHEFPRPFRQCHDDRIASAAYDSFCAEIACSRGRLSRISSFHGAHGVARLAHRVFLDAPKHKSSGNLSDASFCLSSSRFFRSTTASYASVE